MIFLLAPDSFKESMTAINACDAMERGILRAIPGATCIKAPMADGGDGFMMALIKPLKAIIYTKEVTGPLGDKVVGEYAISADGTTGIVELASASGLHLVPQAQRNPMITTTYGTGELIKEVINRGAHKIIIGLGGSATNDGGSGLLQALGVKLLDEAGFQIGLGGAELSRLVYIEAGNIPKIDFEVACDVKNCLCGQEGASQVFGPQKGASPDMALQLDANLRHFAQKIKEYLHVDTEYIAGAAAAGGTAAGIMAFMHGRLVPGIELVIHYNHIEEKVKTCDYVFTGEGSLDMQTLQGKTISGILKLATQYSKPVIAFAGKLEYSQKLYEAGLTAAIGILTEITPLDQALLNGPQNLENAAEAIARILFKVK